MKSGGDALLRDFLNTQAQFDEASTPLAFHLAAIKNIWNCKPVREAKIASRRFPRSKSISTEVSDTRIIGPQ
jgi:hypothetical protein